MFNVLRKSIKIKLFVLFLAMNLSGILLVGFISYQSKKEALREQVENNLSVISAELADKVDRFLGARLNDTKAIALHYSLYGLKTTTSSQNKILSKYLKIYPYYDHISIINVEDVKAPERKRGIESYNSHWYLPAMYGEVVSSDMSISPLTEKPTMAFAAPVFDDKGRVVSIINTNLNLEYLWDIVDQIKEENKKSGLTGYAFILNKEGTIIAHPVKDKVLKENVLKYPDKELRDMVKEMISGRSGTATYTYEGITKAAAYAPCKGFSNYLGHGWSIGVTYPQSELYAPLRALLTKYIMILLLTSLIMFFISTRLANYIVRPILALKDGASTIGAGNFNMRIDTNTSDEIGDLAKSFNRMAETLEIRDMQIQEYTGTLTRINDELAKKQEELRHANEVLTKTNEELVKLQKQKAEFTAMITHDIKSPLSTVITYTEMLLGGIISNGGEDLQKALTSIHASGYKILSLVENFLASSAIEAGKLQLNRRPQDINDFIEDEIPLFAPQMEKKRLGFSFVKTPGLPPVEFDKVQLDRAFSNILSNAIKFTHPNGSITISTGLSGGHVFITVSDTGSGIPADELDGLFNKYQRAKGAASEKGHGLGLYIAKAIVEAHGGELSVVSKQGEGSAFTISLPCGPKPPTGAVL